MMNKKKFSFSAALLLAAALIASGCQQQQKPADPTPNPTPTPDPTPAPSVTGSSAAIEFYRALEIGEVTVWVGNNTATVRFKDKAGVTFGGNGPIAADGKVSFDLHEVNHSEHTIPFEGTYEAKGPRFILRRLTKPYPKNSTVLLEKADGNIVNPQRSFIRYVDNLKGLGAVFTITLDTDRVYLTGWYGAGTEKQHYVASEAKLEGNEANTEIEIESTSYRVRLVFNEDERVEGDDTRTVWYLGSKNPKYRSVSETPEEPEYIGGFYLYKQEIANRYAGQMIPQSVVVEKTVKLYKDGNQPVESNPNASPLAANYNHLGTLDIKLVGNEAQLTMRHTRLSTTDPNTATNKGSNEAFATKLRVLTLRPMKNHPGLYESEPMASAGKVVNPVTATERYKIVGGKNAVFTFLSERDISAGNDVYDKLKYNTYDFKISEYNPKTGSFRLYGKALLNKVPAIAAGQQAGAPLLPPAVLTTGVTADPIYYNFSKNAGAVLNGERFL